MNAREAYDLCGLLAGMRKEAEKELQQFVEEQGDDAMRLLFKIRDGCVEGALALKDEASVMAACTVLQLSKCFEQLAKARAGSELARDN